ncbi:MAG: hypothetical protein K9L75_02660 [Spirochaetia bacterium]|nr:hypothetical protein [Spirochaetia bacterium]
MSRRLRIPEIACIVCLFFILTTSCNLLYDIFYHNAELIIHNQTETTITAVYADRTLADEQLPSSSLIWEEAILPGGSAELGKLQKGDTYLQVAFKDGSHSDIQLISITKEIMDVYIQE